MLSGHLPQIAGTRGMSLRLLAILTVVQKNQKNRAVAIMTAIVKKTKKITMTTVIITTRMVGLYHTKENNMPKLEKYNEKMVYSDRRGGAVLMPDKYWYPFAYFTNGELDIFEDLPLSDPEAAFGWYKKIFT
jgi:hypothetical protein